MNSISNLDRCVSLTDLSLSSNNISAISGLDNLASLQRLDLSFNRITRIGKSTGDRFSEIACFYPINLSENLRMLGGLEYLDLRGNQISDLGDLSSLVQVSENVPVSSDETYPNSMTAAENISPTKC